MIDWIVYGDGWERTSEDCKPEDVPGQGVLVIAQKNPEVGRELIHGGMEWVNVSYYWYDLDRKWWCGGTMDGLIDYLMQPGKKVVKFGRSVPTTEFRKVVDKAINDDRLPRKSARYHHEPKGSDSD